MRYDEFCAMAIGRLVNMNIAANGVQLVEIDNLPEDTLLSYIRDNFTDKETTMVHMTYHL